MLSAHLSGADTHCVGSYVDAKRLHTLAVFFFLFPSPMRFSIALILIFALSWIPLVGAFHYETALTLALAGTILVPICLSRKRQPKTQNPDTPTEEAPRDDAHPPHPQVWHTLLITCAFWVSACALLALTAFIRGELFCDFWGGLQYLMLIALPANILAGLTWEWTKQITRWTALHIAIYVACIALDLGFTLFALFSWPPLVAFGQFFGFFAGSIYDEAIHITQALIAYRCGTLVLCICLAWAQTKHAKYTTKLLLPVLGLLLACLNHAWLAHSEQIPPFGHQKLQNTLWQTVSAPDQSFHVHFIPQSKNPVETAQQKRQLLLAYTRDYKALEHFFGNRPDAPKGIDIWLYPTRNEKAKFIGAKNTSFARVWLNEIHLVQTSPNATLAKHEMAHLFAAQFGNGPLKVAGGLNIPALGWIEGLAMAAEWPIQQGFDLHAWSAAIIENPQTFGTFSPHQLIYGFWGMPSRVAYTLAGSYVRFLIEHYGIDKVKTLSQNMPGDFENIIGLTFDEAFSAWKIWLKTRHAHPKAVHTVDLVFGSASIWTKTCARASAAQSSRFYQCLSDMTCSDIQTIPLTTCENASDIAFPKVSHAPLSLDEIWALYLTVDPLLTPFIPQALITLSKDPHFKVLAPAFQAAFQAFGMSASTPNTDDCQPQTLNWMQDVHAASKLRQHMADIIHTQWQGWSKAAQYQWLERLGDLMWHSQQHALGGLIYSILRQQFLPESTARRLDIKRQAIQNSQNPTAYAIQRWFVTTHPQEQLQIALTHPQAPIIAYLDFMNAIHTNDMPRAQNAFTRLMLYSQHDDPATRMSAKTWAETLRLAPYLKP